MSARKIALWHDAGLIDAATRDRLLAYEAAHARPLALWAVFGIGALAIGLGLVSVISPGPVEKLVLPVLTLAIPISAPLAQILMRNIDQVLAQLHMGLAGAEEHAVRHDDRTAAAEFEHPQHLGDEEQFGLFGFDYGLNVLGTAFIVQTACKWWIGKN